MVEPTTSESYRFKDNKIKVMPYFLYEISIYKITKNMVNMLDSKYFKSNKLLGICNEYNKFRNNLIVKYVDLLGAPIEFIKENNLPLYELRNYKK